MGMQTKSGGTPEERRSAPMLQKKIKTPAEKTKETNDYATDKEKKRKKDQKETGLGIHRGPKTISAGGETMRKEKIARGRGARRHRPEI